METNIFAAIPVNTKTIRFLGMFNNYTHNFVVTAVVHNYEATNPHVMVQATETDGAHYTFYFFGVGKDMLWARYTFGGACTWYTPHVWIGGADDETMQSNTWYFLGGE